MLCPLRKSGLSPYFKVSGLETLIPSAALILPCRVNVANLWFLRIRTLLEMGMEGHYPTYHAQKVQINGNYYIFFYHSYYLLY